MKNGGKDEQREERANAKSGFWKSPRMALAKLLPEVEGVWRSIRSMKTVKTEICQFNIMADDSHERKRA